MKVVKPKRIRKEVSKSNILVTKVYKLEYQKEGTQTAELKQQIITKTHYPSKVIANNLQDNVFSANEFNFEESVFENKETRVTWISVPEDVTIQEVQERLNKLNNPTLYKILSNRPILTETQEYAINNPELDVTLDTFANKQVVRYPEGHENAGELALDTYGKVQYKAIFFSKEEKEDIDLRTSDPQDFYVSPEISSELNLMQHVVKGQTI